MKYTIAFTVAYVAAIFLSHSNAQAALTHHYTFDGDSLDSVGTAHGTLNNGASLTAVPAEVKSGSGALKLVGGSSRMSLPQINFGNAMTVAGWYWTNSTGPSTLIANRPTGAFQNGFHLYTNGGLVVLETANGGSFDAALSSGGVVATGAYHHLAMTINRTGGLARLYWDGIDVTSDGTVRNDFGNNNTNVTVGSSSINFSFTLNGFIDDLKIYDEVLSANAVAVLAGVVPEPAGLLLAGVGLLSIASVARRRKSGHA